MPAALEVLLGLLQSISLRRSNELRVAHQFLSHARVLAPDRTVGDGHAALLADPSGSARHYGAVHDHQPRGVRLRVPDGGPDEVVEVEG